MNIFIPNYKETFRLNEEATIEVDTWHRFNSVVDKSKDFTDIFKKAAAISDRTKVIIPKDTIMEVKSIRIRRSDYRNFVTLIMHHEKFKGIQYKTVGKLLVDFFEEDIKQLNNLDVEIIDDPNN